MAQSAPRFPSKEEIMGSIPIGAFLFFLFAATTSEFFAAPPYPSYRPTSPVCLFFLIDSRGNPSFLFHKTLFFLIFYLSRYGTFITASWRRPCSFRSLVNRSPEGCSVSLRVPLHLNFWRTSLCSSAISLFFNTTACVLHFCLASTEELCSPVLYQRHSPGA